MDATQPVIAFVASHAHLAYAAVFLLAFLEAVPVVGAVVPGSALVVAIAALVPTGAVRMWPLLAAAVVGAALGDGLSFALGRRHGGTIAGRRPVARHPELVERSRRFIERHGGKSVFLARFMPGLRAFVPLVAGMVGMPAARFYLADLASAFVWAPAHVLPGALVGASLTLAGAAAGRLALLLAVLLALVWLALAVLRLVLRRGVPLLAAGAARLRRWAGRRDTWLARQVRDLLDRNRSEARALALWAGVVVAAAWLFLGVLEDVATGDPLVRLDAAVYRTLQGLRSPIGDAVMIGITELGDPVVVATVAVVVFLWLGLQRAWRTAAYWAGAVGFASIINTVTKLAIHRARPGDLGYGGASAFSFPSGHATVNAVLYGFLAFLIVRRFRPAWRVPVFGAAVAFATAIAFSRLYLGAHWFSDVVGSLAFATAWIVVLGIAHARHAAHAIEARKLALVAGGTLAVIGAAEVVRRHPSDVARYAVRYEIPTMAASEWRRGGWRRLPAYRIDLTGEVEEPLTFQWAGTRQALEARLLRSGWRRPEPWTLAGALSWLATADPRRLPVVPSLEAGHVPGLSMIGPVEGRPDARIVLRLWPADVDLQDGTRRSLWLGSAVEERIARPLSLVSVPWSTGAVSRPRDLLHAAVAGGRIAVRDLPGGGWDGRVLLAEQGGSEPASPPQATPSGGLRIKGEPIQKGCAACPR